ncbi:hemolysin family protein [Treponema primitia]|uniref:hemolysin family protein n=1 Tax=Treponema primitia TaxID=88058 RepID=UPI00397FE65F
MMFLIILLLLIISGVFTLAESSLISSRKARLRSKADGGDKKYRLALKAAENPESLLSALRIGIILADIFAGALSGIPAAGIFEKFFPMLTGSVIPALTTALLFTILLILLQSSLGKPIARGKPEIILVHILPLIRFLRVLFTPLIFLGSRLESDPVTDQGMTEDELRIALREGEKSGIVESEERTMVEGVFYLGDRHVGAFMTHRSEIQWLDINADAEKVRSMAVEYRKQQFFPVASGAIDEIVGVVSVQDIFLTFLENTWVGLKSLMVPPHFVPETMSSIKAFEAFKRGESNILFVIDEYGGFAGVLSVRDLIEEIVGELSASTSADDDILAQGDGAYLVSGSVNIDDIAEILPIAGFPATPQEYHTLAGFILELGGEIPRTGAVFEWNGYRFKVVDMDGNRIDKVLIEPIG